MKYPTLPISSFCSTGSGGTPSRANVGDYYGGTIPWVKSGELREDVILDTEERITELAIKESSAKLVPKGALLIAMYGATIGRIAELGVEGATNQAVCHIVPDEKIADKRYLFYGLRFKVPELIAQGAGGAQPNINQQIIRDTQLPLPPLPEQKRIAAILDKADSIRRKRQEAVRLTEELLRSVFLDMFGDPVTNPKGIKNVCLSEVTTRITDGTHLTPKFIDSGVPFIFVKNIKNGKIDFQTDKYISEEEHKKLYERCPVEEGDILYTTVGATYGQAVAVGSFTKFAFQRHVAHVKPDKSKILSDYLGTIMQLPIVKNQADRWARGAAQPTVNLTELRDFVIPLPPLHLQREFAQKVTSVEKLKSVCRLPLEHAEALFNSLLQRAFVGKL